MDLIPRPEYLRRLRENRGVDLIKIITGLRRSGKSTLLELYRSDLRREGIRADHIIHLNLESLRYRELRDYLAFYDYVSGKITGQGKYYLLFDEIQEIIGWEKAVESFRLDFDVDIYITGSNAFMMSGELATLLSGRYVEIRLLPLSFKEFLTFNEGTASIEADFGRYMQFGGMPVLAQYNFNVPRSNEALEGIYSTVILKDVLQKNSWANQATLEKIVRFLCANIGSIISPNKIGNVLTAEGDIRGERRGQTLAGGAVAKYLRALQDAFFVYHASRYDVRGKQLLKTLGKDYIVDIGFRNMLLGYRNADRGHLLENIVYLELLRRDYRVYIGKIGETEVDFVAEKPQDKIYIQVTESVNSPEVRARELRPLQAISDNYEKIILTMDRDFLTSFEGIRIINLIDWLMA